MNQPEDSPATYKEIKQAIEIMSKIGGNLNQSCYTDKTNMNTTTIAAIIRINEKDAITLFDTGTTGTNLISSTFAHVNNLTNTQYDPPVVIGMATKGSKSNAAAYCE